MTPDKFISDLYAQNAWKQLSNDISKRITYLTHNFLGKLYLSAPQGEGAEDPFDQAPLYRFDGFDCVTFVNNILALVLSHDLSSFQKNLLRINYYDALPRFENRFHFMSVDWNPQNQKNNIVTDITKNIIDQNQRVIADYAQGEINRPGWFLKQSENKKSSALRAIALKMKKEFVSLPYLPLYRLFDKNKIPIDFLFQQIPTPSVIEIVRPNWNLQEKIGTNLHVSHVGFALRNTNNELFFWHASSENKQVSAVKLSDYLAQYIDSPTIKGINVQRILVEP